MCQKKRKKKRRTLWEGERGGEGERVAKEEGEREEERRKGKIVINIQNIENNFLIFFYVTFLIIICFCVRFANFLK